MAVILIVEDDIFIRQSAEMVVQDWGYQTLVAGDVEEALAFLTSDQIIDGLFTDIYLKKSVLGGCDLATAAVCLRPGLPVLYTTGNIITAAMTAAFVKGSHCLRKPYADDQLRHSIEDMLAA